MAALKAKPGRDIWLFGGGELFRSLLDAGLVDTVEVAVVPVLLGGGIPLLPPGAATKLTLVDQKTLPASGIVALSSPVPGGDRAGAAHSLRQGREGSREEESAGRGQSARPQAGTEAIREQEEAAIASGSAEDPPQGQVFARLSRRCVDHSAARSPVSAAIAPMQLNPSATELTTAATDAALGLLCLVVLLRLRAIKVSATWKRALWCWVFGLLVVASVLGTVVHGLELSESVRSVFGGRCIYRWV